MTRRTYQHDPFRDGQTTAVTVVEQAAVDLAYDYSTVAEGQREAVRRSALVIKPRLKRATEDIFVIGKELNATKALLPHGEYAKWLDVEFGLSDRMAQRFVNVYERLGVKSDIMSDLPPTTLYLLAAPSTPDEAIEVVEKQLSTGERCAARLAHHQRSGQNDALRVESGLLDAFQQSVCGPLTDDSASLCVFRLDIMFIASYRHVQLKTLDFCYTKLNTSHFLIQQTAVEPFLSKLE